MGEDKKLTSIQLLETVRLALVNENLHVNFDYFSMNQRYQALFSSIREDLIINVKSAPAVTPAQKVMAAMSKKEAFRRFSLSEYLTKGALPDGDMRQITASILLSHPSATDVKALEEAQKLLGTAWVVYLALQTTNVSLAKASRVMNQTIEKEGDAELKKSCAICVPIIFEDWPKFFERTVESKGQAKE
jgi:hypothetical protein